MKYYILNDEELIEFVNDLIANEDYLKDFLKSGQQVGLIAEGEVTKECGNLDIYFIDKKQINIMFKKYNGKNIKIYVGEK